MSEVGHDLHSEFPADRDILMLLKRESARFQLIAEQHHRLVQEIHRIEAGLAPSSDVRLEDLKKQRLAILDEVAGHISLHKAA